MNTKEYQTEIYNQLGCIFGAENVKKEWNTTKFDPHPSSHTQIYAPFLDIAVGPFNPFWDLDIGNDLTEGMKTHPFTQRIVQEIGWDNDDYIHSWNKFSRCYLAIEIEFSGKKHSNSLKHIFGSMINASVNGSIGIVITDSSVKKKVSRLFNYIRRLDDVSGITIPITENLIRIEKDEFLSIIEEVKYNL